MERHRVVRLSALLLCLGSDPALAQNSDADLAKKLANPIASLISVPFQSNWDCCYGPRDGGRYTLNIQPVVPVALNHDWNLIIRTIVPLIYQQSTSPLTGAILAMARGAGEVAPLMLVGAVKLAPELPIDGHVPFVHMSRSFMHLGFHIFDLGFQSQNSEAAKPMVYTTTLLLIVLVALLNVSAIWLRTRLRRKFQSSQF